MYEKGQRIVTFTLYGMESGGHITTKTEKKQPSEFASDGGLPFSVWGYVDNAYSLVNIQAMCDSVAYCISRAALNQLFSLIYRACQPGTPTHGSSIPTTRELAHKPRKSTGQGTLPESHQRDTGIIAICTSKTYSILSVDHTAVAQQDSGGDSS